MPDKGPAEVYGSRDLQTNAPEVIDQKVLIPPLMHAVNAKRPG